VRVIDYADYLPAKDNVLHKQLINRIFVRDLACVFGNTLLPGEAGTSMRRPEYVLSHLLFEKWFDPSVFPLQANNSLKALEYGDVMVLNKDAVFINTGIRTSMESIQMMKRKIFEAGFSEIGVIDLPRRPDTMHLDMNGNVVGKDLFLAKSYMRFFPVHILSEKEERFEMTEAFLNRHGFEVEWTSEINHTVADINFLNIDPETLLVSKKANKKIFSHHPKLK
ncbi:arginine deiminase family protein, partial [Halobacillus sp. BBL2006]|uniref:arginine deiminase family protein n=1 Tax=Halobacillus sp. BBL2006 TaxID=1543706 RepID=UPI000543E29C